MKKTTYLVASILLFATCQSSVNTHPTDEKSEVVTERLEFYGNTQGTTYAVVCNDPIQISANEIDSVLHNFDLALSSYIPNSILTKINNAPAGQVSFMDINHYFDRCYNQSLEVYKLTNGAFDPTVYPLVDGWGFMKNVEEVPDSTTVDSLMQLVSFNPGYHFTYFPAKTDSTTSFMQKNTPHTKMDFNAIAQGLSVDVICELIESKGGENYYVEIGGEIRVSGLNSEGRIWTIGIDKPKEHSTADNREVFEIVQVDNKAIATSGSYRKFYEKKGVKYSHTLNPKTGYPVTHSLLSTTVVADNCTLADGLATAFMVMGTEKTVQFVKDHPELNIEVYLIYYNSKGRMETYSTKGFQEMMVD